MHIHYKYSEFEKVLTCVITYVLLLSCSNADSLKQDDAKVTRFTSAKQKANNSHVTFLDTTYLDTTLYNLKLMQLAHNKPSGGWPVRTPYPLPGAILPFKRVVAFYGNLYSKGMGILGALPKEQMLKQLKAEVKSWEKADSTTPVIPALHYIAVTAQRSPGTKEKYRLRMPFHQIDKILEIAKEINALVFLDIQVGHSTLQQEVPELKKYLMMPHVHLGIDPEYSMKGGEVPCTVVGTFDAADINYTSNYLAKMVREYKLPPKILVVHRFTQAMVTNYKSIQTHPEVQIVMHMDGFGYPAKKINTYERWIEGQPVQFTGFKLFYKNDIQHPKWPVLMKPEDILVLNPKPIYIQYQ